tara:strand:- start:2557 stop:2937 length:381 start_codon:yes stop_codon:yes gene_type:complete
MAATTKKKKSSKSKKNQETELSPHYTILWEDDGYILIKILEESAKGTIVRFADVSFGDVAEDGSGFPVSFSAWILDNPLDIDFEARENEEETSYLGVLIANVVMDKEGYNEEETTSDAENRNDNTK